VKERGGCTNCSINSVRVAAYFEEAGRCKRAWGGQFNRQVFGRDGLGQADCASRLVILECHAGTTVETAAAIPHVFIMKAHRRKMKTKIILGSFVVAVMGVLCIVPLNMPRGDQSFARGVIVCGGLVLLVVLALADTFYCPKCGRDTGHFRARLTGRVSRQDRVICRHCGCRMNGYGRPLKD